VATNTVICFDERDVVTSREKPRGRYPGDAPSDDRDL
jgi:hypothetical protein